MSSKEVAPLDPIYAETTRILTANIKKLFTDGILVCDGIGQPDKLEINVTYTPSSSNPGFVLRIEPTYNGRECSPTVSAAIGAAIMTAGLAKCPECFQEAPDALERFEYTRPFALVEGWPYIQFRDYDRALKILNAFADVVQGERIPVPESPDNTVNAQASVVRKALPEQSKGAVVKT